MSSDEIKHMTAVYFSVDGHCPSVEQRDDKWAFWLPVVCNFLVFSSFFSRLTCGPLSTKLGTKHSWLKGIQMKSFFQGGYHSENKKKNQIWQRAFFNEGDS